MRDSLRTLARACLLAGVAAAGVTLPLAPGQDGLPDISGAWTGKVSFRDDSLDPGSGGDTGHLDLSMVVSQDGPDLAISATVTGSPEGPQEFDFSGRIGNRTFWAFNGDGLAPFILSGRVSNSGKSMKATGFYDSATDVRAIRLAAKRTP